MKILNCSGKTCTVEIGALDLLIMCNALNEVCHALDIREFQTRMGAYKEEVESLLKELNGIFDGLKKDDL